MSENAISQNPPPPAPTGQTPWSWRLGIAAGITLLGLSAYGLRDLIGLRGQAAIGIVFFFGLVAACSSNLRAVNWRTIGWGVALQVVLALFVLKVGYTRDLTDKE